MKCNCNLLQTNILNPPLDCQKTWDLIGQGNTKGIFQLESQLGRSLAKQLKPENMEHLSALISISRPGSMENIFDGKSTTQHYIDRKNSIEPITYFHPSLEPTLKETFGCLIYQESSLQIARDIAGFNLQEADTLRKSVGKKIPELMSQVKKQFLEGCDKTKVVNVEEAENIFGWIQKGQRYLFNKSHGVAYAYNSYITAYCKAHYPKEFFTAYLQYSNSKPDQKQEVKELINNMRVMDIPVYPPDLRLFNNSFSLIEDQITFGLTDIKGIGAANIAKLKDKIENVEQFINRRLKDWSWVDFLVFLSAKVDKTTIENLIGAGALDFLNIDRSQMEHDYYIWSKLKEREQLWIQNELLRNPSEKFNLSQLLTYLLNSPTGKSGGIYHKKRISLVEGLKKLIDNPPYLIKDTVKWIVNKEKELLGINLTSHKLDDYSLYDSKDTCRDIMTDSTGLFVNLIAEIITCKEYKIKKGKFKGKEMAFLTLSDQTGEVDSITIFSDQYDQFKDLLYEGNICFFKGKWEKRGIIINFVAPL